MGDTLRSIVEEMEHEAKTQNLHPSWKTFREIHDRLEALLAKYERVDLVKQWKQVANDMRVAATRERAYAERFYRAEHLRNARDFDDTANLYDACADVLETWLAVNLERIKAQARLARKEQVSK